ncbi:hypothetical protein AVEN_248646-1 [Araneus ventricosus]|uniref:Uncharacterized protein n=1 Tax=Araneus ventricosus TaxID=182803 RepID=A0A4Y2BZW1_ARAVE|nr:hypothetical protein AVEN_248646-1 [Araneus ventricosus]
MRSLVFITSNTESGRLSRSSYTKATQSSTPPQQNLTTPPNTKTASSRNKRKGRKTDTIVTQLPCVKYAKTLTCKTLAHAYSSKEGMRRQKTGLPTRITKGWNKKVKKYHRQKKTDKQTEKCPQLSRGVGKV